MRGPIARATVRTSAVFGLRLLAQAGTLLVVARLLGPHAYGAFAGVAALAVLLGSLSTFGTHLVLLREVSREPQRRAEVLPFALGTTLLCGSALLVLYLQLTLTLFAQADIAFTVLLALGITELLLQPLLNQPSAELQGHGRIATAQMLSTLPLILRLGVALAVWVLRPSDPLAAYAWGYLAASALTLLLAMRTLQQAWPAWRTWRLPRRAELRDAAGYAVLNLTASGPAELDKTLAAALLPLAAAGVYAAGARVIGALTLPVIAMMLAALPRLFREAETDRARSSRLLRWVFASAFGYSVLLAAALWLAAPLFDTLFGARYAGLADTLRWLTLAVPGMALRITAGSALMALGKPWMRVGFELGGLIVLTLAALLLTSHAPAHAMPLALACAESTMALTGLIMIIMFQQRTTVRMSRAA